MAASLPTASQLDRAIACPASLTLPVVTQATSPAARNGIVLHSFIEAARADPAARAKALAAIDDEDLRARAEAIDLSAIPRGADSEVAFGWDPATDAGTRYPNVKARGYPDDGLLHGTADLVFVADGTVHIWDFKTGVIQVSADSWQLKFLALAACRYAGASRATVAIQQLGFSGRWFTDEATLEEWDLDEVAGTLRALPARAEAAGAASRFSPGEHCRYCPSISYCPAQTALAKAVIAQDVTPERLAAAVLALPLAEAGGLWPKVIRAEAVLKAIKDALKARAVAEALPLPDGRKVMEVVERRREVKAGATEALAQMVGAEAALSVARLSAPDVEAKFPAEAETLRGMELMGYKEIRKVQVMGKKK